MKYIPSRKQWKNWSLPAKYALIGIIITILLFAVDKLFTLYLHYDEKEPEQSKSAHERVPRKDRPFFNFITERKCQDPAGKYCDEIVYIINLGLTPLENIIVTKSPLPDNMMKRAFDQFKINKPRSKRISILGIGVDHKKLLYRERSYSGKNVRIKIRCRVSHDKYEIIYEGEPSNLKLTRNLKLNTNISTQSKPPTIPFSQGSHEDDIKIT